MPDKKFFKLAGPFTLRQLAEIGGCEIADAANAEKVIRDVNSLHDAGDGEISFLLSKKYIGDLEKTHAAACIVHPDFQASAPAGTAVLLSKEP